MEIQSPKILIACIVYFGFTPVQLYNQQFQNSFNSIVKDGIKKNEFPFEILKQEVSRGQQEFDTMKEELRFAQHKNQKSNICTRSKAIENIVANKRAIDLREPDPVVEKQGFSVLNDFNFDTKMSPEINKLLEDIDAGKKSIDSAPSLPPDVNRTLSEKLMVEWIYHSNAIEGNTLTLDETRLVLGGSNVSGKSFREIKEAQNHRKAIEFIEGLAKEKGVFTGLEILQIHYLLLDEIAPGDAGKYRLHNVIIVDAMAPPQFIHIPDHMAALMKWYHQAHDVHPIKRIAIFYTRFEMIQPFFNGTGPMGRLIANLQLMKLGYPSGIMKYEYKMRYQDAMRTACFTNDYSKMTTEIALSVQYTLNMYLDALNLT